MGWSWLSQTLTAMERQIANENDESVIDESLMKAVQHEVKASAIEPLRAVLTQPLRRLLGDASLWYLSFAYPESFGFRYITYHSIDDCRGNDVETVTIGQFDQQMAWLRDRGYRVITVSQLTEYLGNKPPMEPLVALSFDDGYLDNYINAFPILYRNDLRPRFMYLPPILASAVFGIHRITSESGNDERRQSTAKSPRRV
jgi:hypothetical protein